MPELPEVETVRLQLEPALSGRTIQEVVLLKMGREFPSGEDFVRALTGKKVRAIERRAKLLVFRFEDGEALTAHLKMTGKFLFASDREPEKHDRAIFMFDDGTELVWSDVRQFGFLRLVSAEELERILSAYGPEPLEASVTQLASRIVKPDTRRIKSALLDQATIAGIGNIYADESCHRAGIRPMRRLATLTEKDRVRLAQEIKNVLGESLAQRGTSANDYVDTQGKRGGFLSLLRVYGRAGEPCRTCKTPIERIVLAQRGTHYCPACQS